MKHLGFLLSLWLILSLILPKAAPGDEAFEPGEWGGAKLEIVKGVPVLTVTGTPEQMGEAHGKLLFEQSGLLIRSYLKPAAMFSGGLDRLKASAMKMDRHVPERFRREMKVLARAAGQEYGMVLTGAAFPDVYRGGGCSTLAAGGPAVKDGRPLLARNLDFFPMGVLDRYGIVALCRPEGHHAFVNVTWPGLIGVLSGMNDEGLCCAVMEVRSGVRRFEGMPSVFLFRRILEEAVTVEEGLKILKENARVASNNLTLLDATGASAVAEIGPGRFKVRVAKDGLVFATNHHRVGRDPAPSCGRFRALAEFCERRRGKIDVPLLKNALHRVNQGMISVQSMIFEPAALRLHLSMGVLPATRGPFRSFDFKDGLEGFARAGGAKAPGSESKDF
jgi:hypothetical protein